MIVDNSNIFKHWLYIIILLIEISLSPFFKPKFYNGELEKCINYFLENYNLIFNANEWSEEKKAMYFLIYLKKVQ